MILHHQIQQYSSDLTPIVFIHGLFGSLSNLGMLARHYAGQRTVIQFDVRNHGLSPHSEEMNYQAMAQDIIDSLDALDVEKVVVIGHSMGGKISMALAALAPERVEKLIVLDMAPFEYKEQHHDQIFKALFAVEQAKISSRADATALMSQYIHENMVIQFLLKSFNQGTWRFNLGALFQHYADILSWHNQTAVNIKTLFLKGEHSFYISTAQHFAAIDSQFSRSTVVVIENAGHWLHAEKTETVIQEIDQFLTT